MADYRTLNIDPMERVRRYKRFYGGLVFDKLFSLAIRESMMAQSIHPLRSDMVIAGRALTVKMHSHADPKRSSSSAATVPGEAAPARSWSWRRSHPLGDLHRHGAQLVLRPVGRDELQPLEKAGGPPEWSSPGMSATPHHPADGRFPRVLDGHRGERPHRLDRDEINTPFTCRGTSSIRSRCFPGISSSATWTACRSFRRRWWTRSCSAARNFWVRRPRNASR